MTKEEFKRTISYVNLNNKAKALLFTPFVLLILLIFIEIQILFFRLTKDAESALFGFSVGVLIGLIILSPLFIYGIVLLFKLRNIVKNIDDLIGFQKFITKHFVENYASYRYLISFQVDNIEREMMTERIHNKDQLKNKNCHLGYLNKTNTLLVLETSYKYMNCRKEELSDG